VWWILQSFEYIGPVRFLSPVGSPCQEIFGLELLHDQVVAL
jgi:hypothetical protein